MPKAFNKIKPAKTEAEAAARIEKLTRELQRQAALPPARSRPRRQRSRGRSGGRPERPKRSRDPAVRRSGGRPVSDGHARHHPSAARTARRPRRGSGIPVPIGPPARGRRPAPELRRRIWRQAADRMRGDAWRPTTRFTSRSGACPRSTGPHSVSPSQSTTRRTSAGGSRWDADTVFSTTGSWRAGGVHEAHSHSGSARHLGDPAGRRGSRVTAIGDDHGIPGLQPLRPDHRAGHADDRRGSANLQRASDALPAPA